MNKFFVFIILFFTMQTVTGKEDKQTVSVDPATVLRKLEKIPVGININFYIDSDKATKAPTSLSQAIKNLGVSYLRYPGGDKSDEYLFACPPYDKAEPHPTRKGKNSSLGRGLFMDPDNGTDYKYPPMDFDEFIEICRETGCEPIIVVAADTRNHPFPEGVTGVSTVEEMLENAVEWVRYANIKKKYNIQYWMIGNECWHNNVGEYYSLDDYISDIRLFSDAMKAVDPSIQIIPNTNNRQDFTERLLTEAGDKFDMLCISNYPIWGYAGYEDWAWGEKKLMGSYQQVADLVEKQAPADKKNMQIIVAEYGAFTFGRNDWGSSNDMGHTMCNFDLTGKQLLEERIPFSCYWNTRWVYDNDRAGYNALDDNNNLLPVGWSLAFWAKHLFPEMIATETSSDKIIVFSSHNPETHQIYIYVMNKAEEQLPIDLNVKNREIEEVFQVARMSGEKPDDFSPVIDTTIHKVSKSVELPPYSINIYELKIKSS